MAAQGTPAGCGCRAARPCNLRGTRAKTPRIGVAYALPVVLPAKGCANFL